MEEEIVLSGSDSSVGGNGGAGLVEEIRPKKKKRKTERRKEMNRKLAEKFGKAENKGKVQPSILNYLKKH